MAEIMTQEEYLRNSKYCPVCRSSCTDECEDQEYDCGEILEFVHCSSCNSRWRETYSLVEYTLLERGKP